MATSLGLSRFFLPPAGALALFLLFGCGTVDRHLEVSFAPGEPGLTKEDPLLIPSTPGDTASVVINVTSVDGFTGDASLLVFPDPLCLKDINDDEKCIDVTTFPARPYHFVSSGQTKPITVIFDAEDGMETEADAVYRIRIAAGAVGELVETGTDLYFQIVP